MPSKIQRPPTTAFRLKPETLAYLDTVAEHYDLTVDRGSYQGQPNRGAAIALLAEMEARKISRKKTEKKD